jgi:hypothetical protein
MMGQAFEFDGQLFETEGEFLDALAHEYKSGDRELVVDALEHYGYTLADLGVRPGGSEK